MTLPDPRLYPRVNPQNPLIRQLMSFLSEKDAANVAQKRQALRDLIGETLSSNDHYALNGALTQAPSQEAWLALWQGLRDVVEQRQQARHA